MSVDLPDRGSPMNAITTGSRGGLNDMVLLVVENISILYLLTILLVLIRFYEF